MFFCLEQANHVGLVYASRAREIILSESRRLFMQRHVKLVYRNTDIPSGTSPAEKIVPNGMYPGRIWLAEIF